ncbi:MAG: bifunctional DedA family/phosphatase PAP2 family protein [Solirubrobacterales bacterium]
MTIPLATNGIQLTAALAALIWLPIAVTRWRRGKLDTEAKVISIIGIAGLALYAAGAFSWLPQPEQVLEDISGALGKWTYLLVGVLAFLETGAFIGLVAPGEAAVVVGGVVAGQGEIDIRLLIGIVWFAAFAGDSVSYYLGHRLGREFLVKHGPRVKITEARLEQVEHYMREHGGKTILIGRFIGLVRALAPFIAGSSKMPYRRFMPYDIIGSGLWAITFCMLGYIFSNNLDQVIHWAERGVLIFGWVVGTIVVVVYLVRRFRKPEEREKLVRWLDEQEDQSPTRARVLRPIRRGWEKFVLPVYRFFGPQLRFAWARLTPGDLGLEFTTVMAVLVTAGYTLYFYTVAAADWPTAFTTRLNDAAFRVCESIRTDWLDTLSEAITHLGAFPVAAAFTLIAAGYCIYRRHVAEALVLVISLAVAGLLVTPLKDLFEVPRPSGSLVPTQGWSYPSGHAAYAVTYIAIAVTLERVRDLLARAFIVVLAIALTIAIALSRVYLRAHYLTDVIGGVALTATITAVVAALAFLILHIRNLRTTGSSAGPSDDADIVA